MMNTRTRLKVGKVGEERERQLRSNRESSQTKIEATAVAGGSSALHLRGHTEQEFEAKQ
jgi:hypothetical protein